MLTVSIQTEREEEKRSKANQQITVEPLIAPQWNKLNPEEFSQM
jgi:hypothetical protein